MSDGRGVPVTDGTVDFEDAMILAENGFSLASSLTISSGA